MKKAEHQDIKQDRSHIYPLSGAIAKLLNRKSMNLKHVVNLNNL